MKFTVRFRGREITHPEKAQEQLTGSSSSRGHRERRTARLDGSPYDERSSSPEALVMQKVAQAKAQREEERQQAKKKARRA